MRRFADDAPPMSWRLFQCCILLAAALGFPPVAVAANVAPTTAMLSPLPGSFVREPALLSLSASAADSDGSVSKVEFFQGLTKVGESLSAPYAVLLSNVPAGSYNFTAVATDNLGASATSLVTVVTVVTNGRALRIMPLGDSLTVGFTNFPGGYRIELLRLLTNAGFQVDFVGSQTNGPPELSDPAHEGHNGYRIEQIANEFNGWFASAQPDVILLMIGANDVIQSFDLPNAPARLGSLIDQITSNAPNAHLVVATTTPLRQLELFRGILDYNATVPGVVAPRIAAGKRVSFVDMYKAYPVTDLEDGIHPGAAGYAKMADYWFGVLSPLLGGSAPPQVTLTAPANGLVYNAPTNLTLTAAPTDLEHAITRVEFFQNLVKIGEATNAPFEFTITNLASGLFTYCARATDASGAAAFSGNVSVSDDFVFVRGVNLNGPALTIDGYPWLAYSNALASGLSVSGNVTPFDNGVPYPFVLSPPTDNETDTMLRSAVYRSPAPDGGGFTVTQAVSNNFYAVYLWLVENNTNNFRDMNVRLEGELVASGIGDLPRGQWQRYGPYGATVTDGALDIEVLRVSKGEPILYGFALFRLDVSNSPPTLSDIPNQFINEDQVIGPLALTVTDAETPEGLTFRITSSNPAVVPTNSVVIGGSSSNRTVTVTPAANASGFSTITLTVLDPFGGSASDSFVVSVAAVDDPPSAQSFAVATPINFAANLALVGADAEGSALSFRVVTAPSNGVLRVLDTNGAAVLTVTNDTVLGTVTNLNYRPGTNFNGVDGFTYLVSAGGQTSVLAAVSIAVDGIVTRAINLGGNSSAFVEGFTFISYADAQMFGLSASNGFPFDVGGPYGFPLVPSTDSGASNLLQSVVFRPSPNNGEGFTLTQTLPDAEYLVYFWMVENFVSNYRDMDVKLEGALVVPAAGDLPLGHWRRYGPFRVTVADGALDVDVLRVSKGDPTIAGLAVFQLNASNSPPTISNIGDQVTAENTPVGPVAFTVGDLETPGNFTLLAASSNPALLPTNNIVFGGSGTNRTLTLTPATSLSGTSVVTVTVIDAFGASASDEFVLTVTEISDPPVALNSNVIAQAGLGMNFTLGGFDPDGQPVTYRIVNAPTNGQLRVVATNGAVLYLVTSGMNLGATNQLNYLANGAYTGADSLTFVVRDGESDSAPGTVSFTVKAPFVRGINLRGPAVVIEGDQWLSYSNALATGFTNLTGLTFDNGGPYGFPLTPTPPVDTALMLQTALVSFTTTNGQGVRMNQGVTNGQYQVYYWLLENFQSNSRSMDLRLEGLLVANNVGTLPLGAWQRVGPYNTTVSDGVLNMEVVRRTNGSPQVFGVAIHRRPAVNNRPTISTLANQTIDEDSALGPLAFAVNDAELAAANLTVTRNSSNPSLIPNANVVLGGSGTNRNVTLTPLTNQFGSSVITLTVSDGTNVTTSVFTLTVNPINDPPSAFPLSLMVTQNTVVSFTLPASDVDNSNLTYTVFAAPLRGLLAGAAPNLTYTPAHGYAGGDSFTFGVSDGAVTSGVATVTITVAGAADSDGDGIPDAWEIARGLNPGVNDAGLDVDGDGFTNREEYLADTNPLDPASSLRITSVARNPAGQNVVNWRSAGGVRYRIQYRDGAMGAYNAAFTDLPRSAGLEIDPASPGSVSTRSFTDDFTLTPGTTTNRYYRVKVVPQ
jgi:lysophospholipase L1-like esterase